jgi:hypothetical protein
MVLLLKYYWNFINSVELQVVLSSERFSKYFLKITGSIARLKISG